MKTKHTLVIALIFVMCLILTACGSTTLFENTGQYFSQVGTRLNSLNNSANDNNKTDVDSGKTRLAIPADFTVDSAGNYSFTGVDNADYYVLYMYDAKSDSDEYRYVSNSIKEDGSGTYAGALKDAIPMPSSGFGFGFPGGAPAPTPDPDAVPYTFGSYRVGVIAYPAVTDKDNRASDAATADFLVSGEVVAPKLAYMWDYFSGTFDVQLINAEDYEDTYYPQLVDVTLADANNPSNTVSVSIENVSLEDDVYSATTTDISIDTTYNISASVTWDSDIVTNPSATVNLGTVTISSKDNAISEGFGYLNGNIYAGFDFPEAAVSFDPKAGGSAGIWYDFSNSSESRGNFRPVSFGSDEDVTYMATPITAASGTLYSYRIDGTNPSGSMAATSGMGSARTEDATGTLNIYEGGTFTLTLNSQDLGEVFAPGGTSRAIMPGSEINGTWTRNDDGTINLSYNRSTATLVD
jgi:hypothetical protein